LEQLSKPYILALSLIAIFTISTQVFIQFYLYKQESDSRTINIANRQQMLSQKITKHVVLISKSKTKDKFSKYQKELQKDRNLWVKSQEALQKGDSSLSLPKNGQSSEVRKLFESIEPHYQKIKSITDEVMTFNYQEGNNIPENLIEEIIKEEKAFLSLMDKIVFQYEKEAKEKLRELSKMGKVMAFFTLLILVLEAFFIFKPMIGKIQKDIEKIEADKKDLESKLEEKIERRNIELEKQQVKIDRINQKLMANQETLLRNRLRLKESLDQRNLYLKALEKQKEKLQIKHNELKAIEEELRKSNEILEQKVKERTKKIKEQNLNIGQLYKDLSASVSYARRIQQTILPTRKKFNQLIPESFVFFKPRNIVSGDFYFLAEVQRKIIVAAVDCTGHGVPGAFMSLISNDLLTEIVTSQEILKPKKILENLHLGIRYLLRQKETKNHEGMDMSLVVIDKENKTLDFAGAKNPLIYIQENELKIIKGDNMSIGGVEMALERVFTQHQISLEKETTFYLFSDGIQDQFGGEKNKKFTPSRLRNLLLEIHQESMQEQRKIITKTISTWQREGNEEQIDDMLLLGVKIDIKSIE